MRKQRAPTVVAGSAAVPRLTVVYSRMTVPCADLDPGLLALELEVLRVAAQDRSRRRRARSAASRTFRSQA